MPVSYDMGKPWVSAWIRERFPVGSTILDVGAGAGTWRRLLPEYPDMDAVEIYPPNATALTGYRSVFYRDIYGLRYDWYDLVIFGDVIEHMAVERAQEVLRYAARHCKDMVIAVPFLYKQGPVGGNEHERHIQDDLTRELFAERYDGFAVLLDAAEDYCYYHKR